MKTYKILSLVLSIFVLFYFFGCSGGGSSSSTQVGTLSLSLTDAPLVDENNVTGVYISITGIDYHTTGGWKSMSDFNISINPINLLEWQEGKSISLGDFQLPAGKYTQIRFILDAEEEHERPKSNTGSFIEFNNDTNETLYVPSGSKTGYKAIGTYDVPVNGTVNMTADFDVRKSIVRSGDGSYYKLKPTIKLVVTSEAGDINGTVSNLDLNSTYVVYAYGYEDTASTWNVNETNDPDPSDAADIRFQNALSSTIVKDNGSYILAFLSSGTYDLIIAKYDSNGDYVTYYIQVGISVVSSQTTTFNWTL